MRLAFLSVVAAVVAAGAAARGTEVALRCAIAERRE
jgi:hypothetical protein